MIKLLIIFLLSLTLSLNIAVASDKDYGNLTEIILTEGLDKNQTREVAIGLADDLKDLFHSWLTKTHFIFGPRCSSKDASSGPCRQNLEFDLGFSAASVDLDNDGIDDVLVRVEHELVCGAGDCFVVDILLGGDIASVKAGRFGPRNIYVSDKTKHGLKYIYYDAVCTPKFEPEVCNFYMLEPTSSESYSSFILVEEGRKVERE